MKILLLAKGYPPTIGGVENYSYYIAEGLGEKHKVEVLTFDESNDSPKKQLDKNVNVLRLNHSRKELLNGWNMLRAIKSKIAEFTPDLIIATTWKVGLPYAFLKFKYQIPFVLVAHGAEITRHRSNTILMKLMRFVMAKTDLVITVSNFTKHIIQKYTTVSEKNVVTVPNGIDLNPVKPVEQNAARQELGIKSDWPVLLTVSRLDARKGHAKVLKLLPKLKERYSNLLYLIVGNGPEREELERLSDSLGLTDNDVKFAGFVADEELPFYYSACDIFVMLNEMKSEEDFEGFGFVFAEAGAYGKPSIGGNNAGPKEVIDHQKTGFLVNPDSEREVFDSIQKLLDNEEERARMGKTARKKVFREFTLDVMVSNFENKLLQL
ncbi:MAG: hypothetical protein CL666_14000 [Balneola sp.]|nr:hypothetical protein [Balneola sp.]|tara:strand:- start:43023 stop:44159 length:1137 start_codon:yes stop_codon:yes gene_type:complete